MKTGLVICTALTSLIPIVSPASAGPMAREPLDRLWEEHMLAGTFPIYAEGKRVERVSEGSFEEKQGDPFFVAYTKHGIMVSDLRETRFLGLWLKGGWLLQGGLLARVEDQASTVELYGKMVMRAEPVFLFTYFVSIHGPDNVRPYADEFFLLLRKKGSERATVLRKWVFNQQESEMGVVRGLLRYDPATKVATVTILGLKHPFEEHIDLSETLRD